MDKIKRQGYEWGKDHMHLAPSKYNQKADEEAKERYDAAEKEKKFFAGAVEQRLRS